MANPRIETLQKFIDEDPEDTFSRFALALEYLKIEQIEDALSIFLHIRKHNPDYLGVYYHLGKVYERTGQPEFALKAYEDGLKVARQQRDAHTENELQQAKQELELNEY